ncbi:MAG TPA: pitrilysin family protein [Vicinamibacterales bacterium]|nr:pitrilysin family protein [Vicinamibacterales bacterium]
MIPFTKHSLGNGLQVVVHEDHHLPIAAVNIWYHVGSKNEAPGRSGLAHLFEHLMFKGAQHQPRGFFEPLQEAGGSLNGSTSADRTNYWSVVPNGAMELALWMEADRMGWLVPALSAERFETEREVVLNERRQSYDNRPYGLASFALSEAIYPADHPYHWPTIGYPSDLRAATVEDARAFFERYYHPANASLTVAGDVRTDDVLETVERLFGDIPAGPAVARLPVTPVSAVSRRLLLEDRVELPRLYLMFPSPELFAEDDAVLDVTADLVANGRTSRLYRTLMHDKRRAAGLGAGQGSREMGSLFQVVATAAPDVTLEELRVAIMDELGRLTNEGPTEGELDRARVNAEASFLFRLQTLGGFGGKADQLNAYNVYTGSPSYFAQDLERYLRVTTADVRRVAAQYLNANQAVQLSVVPQGQLQWALADSEAAVVTT